MSVTSNPTSNNGEPDDVDNRRRQAGRLNGGGVSRNSGAGGTAVKYLNSTGSGGEESTDSTSDLPQVNLFMF